MTESLNSSGVFMRKPWRVVLVGLLSACLWGLLARSAPQDKALPPAAKAPVDYTADVVPLLQRCHTCHGPQLQSGGLRLDQPDTLLRGGYSGAVVVPGNSAASKLVLRVASRKQGFAMPMAGQPLTAKEVGILRAWIDQGAKIPAAAAGASASSAAAAQTGAWKPAATTHWSFQPIRRLEPPMVRNRAWVRNPIDAFVLSRLEKEAIEPSPEADRATLIRRLSLDLTGLPPTLQETGAFLADNRPDAYERLVERLLTSPHYGEKWARHWLDLAHYADSDGYEKDRTRPWAWRYRNWVIDALNRDLPFDEFTIEQLAGDLLPNATVEQRVATGFLRNTLTNREAGVDRAEVRFEQLLDRTNTTGTAWLGLTVGCAQCHNHKFDPITQKDEYSLMAFFNNTEEATMDAPLPGEVGPYLQARPDYDRKRQEILSSYGVAELQTGWENDMRDAVEHPGRRLDWDFQMTELRAAFDGGQKILMMDPARRAGRQRDSLTDYFLGNYGPAIAKDAEASKKLKEAREKLNALKAEFPAPTQAPVMVEETERQPMFLRVRGDYRQKGIEVKPEPPAFLPPMPPTPSPTRLDLARWIVSRENPLAARVVVNRMWQALFGIGIVRTSEDFGKQGEPPTHPELLDWLASEFIERGWSMKQAQRLMVTSATYRQSSKSRPELESRDPENRLLARQSRFRLPAELIRDSALAASGLLNTATGGRSVKPPQPPGVAELAYANQVKWVESKGPERYRRGLYIHFQRAVPYPQMINFDAPDSVTACSRRRVSNTPLQALNLMNDPVFFEAAQALAARVLAESPSEFGTRLDHAFALCLARRPSAREKQRLADFFERQTAMLADDEKARGALFAVRLEGVEPVQAAAWVAVSRVLLNLDEFVTRE